MPKTIEGHISIQAYVPRDIWERFCRWADKEGFKKGPMVAATIKAAIPAAYRKGLK